MNSLKVNLSSVCKPVDAFHSCPKCGCAELIAVDGDVLCSSCPWDSITIFADALFEQKVGLLFRRDAVDAPRKQNLSLGSARPSVSVVA